jgi:arginase family enzyme
LTVDENKINDRPEKKVVFFGCPFDCDEREESIREKLETSAGALENDDPYEFVMSMIRREVEKDLWDEKGSFQVPDWLRPLPSDGSKLTAAEFASFIDRDGCREFASEVGEFIAESIFPDIPCLLAVDHSLTGGAFRALNDLYGPGNVALAVLDSHTDAIPTPVMSGAIQYDLDTNPKTIHDRSDPLLYNRPDSYHASSFLHHLLDEDILAPENLFLIGISDYPVKRAFRIKDERIRDYVGRFAELKKTGATVLTKEECLLKPKKVRNALRKITTPFLYVSVDMDIGARNAVEGVRFLDWQGLQEKQIYTMIDALRDVLSGNVRLAGMDLTEFNPRRAAGSPDTSRDRTYRVAANIIEKLIFGYNVNG